MTFAAYLVIGLYSVALLYITLYCMLQFHLLYHYRRANKNEVAPPKAVKTAQKNAVLAEVSATTGFSDTMVEEDSSDYPFVTVQLPVYNEMYVIERLIDRVVQFDYPKERYEIQVLDDSTDETVAIIRRKVEQYQAQGYQIEQITRSDRQGYKAGALRDAMPSVKGEFIAIFDADFVPRRDFLKATVPHFQNPDVGVVQTRWAHLNEDYSLLTRLQALQLNVHFTVEQSGRQQAGYTLQFNGTAGVWRKATIERAGGWQPDTLTEDLDLSIRAQLNDWQIVYLEDFDSPAELPADMNGLKSQQFRWMKGGAETARKMLPGVWRSDMSFLKKLHTTAQLLASSVFLFVFLAGVISVPTLFMLEALHIEPYLFAGFMIGWVSIVAIYYVANVQASFQQGAYAQKLLKFLVLFPLFLALSMALSLHNTTAIVQGYLGKKSPFVRTPKFNLQSIKDSFRQRKYRSYRLNWTAAFEGVLALYFSFAVAYGMYSSNTYFLLFHLLLAIGYSAIFYYTVWHLRND